ncbi:hypothetical protein RvY_05703-3 [Ramazzottius varieornatus]|uniref:MYND-type domain-containing protein n=1 Tax=Ramazzottius varieornatus TaxID=947166 RepID=A0A1D1V2L2_RAMVA|nr:hypothetical protein RvY_05703-3 [Ramazzottius varieornatus]
MSATSDSYACDPAFPIGPVKTKMYGPYQIGDRVLYEKPWIFVVSEKCRQGICNHCFQRGPTLKRCTGCGFSWYCGKECQHDKSWNLPSDAFPILPNRTFTNLMHHWEEIQNDPAEMEFLEVMSSYFYKTFKGIADYGDLIDMDQLGVIHGRIRINNMTIFGTYGDKLGVGLYLSGSSLDHACLPNACPSFSGTLLNIHTTESVDCFDNLRLSYLDKLYFSKPRREMLQKRYYFDCLCRACVDESLDKRMNSVRCSNCDGVILMEPFSFESEPCQKCAQSCSEKDVENVRQMLELGRHTQILLSEAKKSDDHRRVLSLSEELNSKLRKVLHPFNSLVISTSLQIACSADILGQYAKAFAHFSELSTTYTKVHPFWTFQNAEILMKCTTRGLIVKTAPKEQLELLKHFVEAMKIVSVCAGRDSPTFAYYKKFYEDCREVCSFSSPLENNF